MTLLITAKRYVFLRLKPRFLQCCNPSLVHGATSAGRVSIVCQRRAAAALIDAVFGQPAFGVDCGFAAHAGGSDGLAVGAVDHVAGGEYALDPGG